MNEIKPVHVWTVAVENSDDRLAEVEKAKRTGQPFVSVAANKTEVVPYDVAAQIAEDKAQENTYVGRFGATYAGQLEDWHTLIREDPSAIDATNEEKARAHAEYSAEFVRKAMEEEAHVQEMMAEGYDPSLAVQQANLERAQEHERVSNEYAQLRLERAKDDIAVLPMVDEAVKILRVEDLANKPLADRAAALSSVTNVPDAMEHPATDAFVIKDKIIDTTIPYEDHAASHEELAPKDNPGIEIMDAAGSPEDLRDSTALAQLRADNMTEEANEAEQEMEEVARDMSLAEDSPGEIEDAAEEAVGGHEESDEMRENPGE